ncbi:hypothetical protein PR202_gb21656 [Eleusine coracana subsp. coracana]|uniref:Uncharacterized protein n=1 Tax=Eleusine coracana subsp. coracana TaxID=191504 RepID=A0AAV5FDP5_ELECO|nr:hypothetical protein PR202_gb21656 [Eleusine coracana subsp. coracana]
MSLPRLLRNFEWSTSLSRRRRDMNPIVENWFPSGAKSLRYVDLKSQLFHDTITPHTKEEEDRHATNKAVVASTTLTTMERIKLPSPVFTLQSASNKVDCFPLADGDTFLADQLGRAFLLDAETRNLCFMPRLHRPKRAPLSLFVHNADADADADADVAYGSSVFVMERFPEPEATTCNKHSSCQFEAFVYGNGTTTFKNWHCRLLPPPPFVRDPSAYWHLRPAEITSYAVVDGGKHVCISVDGGGGSSSSYCLSTKNHAWTKVVGAWTMPFRGKVEYVPELGLWFGFSIHNHRQLAAADLSDMDSQPRLVRIISSNPQQLDYYYYYVPEEWEEYKDPQLVSLGSGRFCVVRFFQTTRTLSMMVSEDTGDQAFAVFTAAATCL